MKSTLWIIIIAALISSCKDNDDMLRQAMVQQELDRKIEEYRKQLMADCRETILKEAEIIADSILLVEDRDPLIKTNVIPSTKVKPQYIPTDSSVYKSESNVKPLEGN